jgi:hypothetical protein
MNFDLNIQTHYFTVVIHTGIQENMLTNHFKLFAKNLIICTDTGLLIAKIT